MDNILSTFIIFAVIIPTLVFIFIFINDPLKPYIHSVLVPFIIKPMEHVRDKMQRKQSERVVQLSEKVYKAFADRIKLNSERHRDRVESFNDK